MNSKTSTYLDGCSSFIVDVKNNLHLHLSNNSFLLILSSLLFFASSCKTTKMPSTSEVTFIESVTENEVTIESIGYGKSESDARVDAFRTAYSTVLFKGLPGFSPLNRPLIPNEISFKNNNPEFFTDFMSNGDYLQFVTGQGSFELLGKSGKTEVVRQNFSFNYRSLRLYLEQKKVIRKFGL